jgi:hypothetical protein
MWSNNVIIVNVEHPLDMLICDNTLVGAVQSNRSARMDDVIGFHIHKPIGDPVETLEVRPQYRKLGISIRELRKSGRHVFLAALHGDRFEYTEIDEMTQV